MKGMLRGFARVAFFGSSFAAAAALAGCGSGGDEGPRATAGDPRMVHAAGTGTQDSVILDAPQGFAREQGIAWFEIELRLLDDDADGTTGVIATGDGMRVAVDFWGHEGSGAVRVEGRFAIDLTRWLGLSVERDPTDIAAIFDGSRVRVPGSAALTAAERSAHLTAVLEAMATGAGKIGSALEGEVASKRAALLDGEALASCAGSAKEAIGKALSAISATFKTCVSCASHAIDDVGSDATWAACGTCEEGITSAKNALGLFDLLACKKALVIPSVGGDSDDAGGPLVSVPEGVVETTCYAQSTDKIHGTFRVTDGKGGVACADCPSGTVPADTKLGCAPAAASGEWSPVDESKSIVLVPQGAGRAPSARVVSADVCVVVDVSATGTVNGLPVEKGPRRIIQKLGDRPWAALPKNVQTSKDQWDLTTDAHTNAQKGRYAIASSSPATSTKAPPATGTVEQAIARGGCASRPVFGLSQQILEELARCVRPDFLVPVPSGGALVNNADHGYLEKPAADALLRALQARPGKSIRISSMYRTIAQQYFLYRRASCFPAVAKPGRSNHETGIAIDVSDPDNSTWRTALQNVGFKWLGSGDRFHFDYKGEGSVDLRGDDVKAFQRLWNRNHPEDPIAEDGVWGPDTESRMKQSPAAGFPIGASESCGPAPAPAAASKGSREPLEYLTNVTADLLPGEGCETGSDASHTDVNACVSVKQVCEPYWCDLGDQRTDACR